LPKKEIRCDLQSLSPEAGTSGFTSFPTSRSRSSFEPVRTCCRLFISRRTLGRIVGFFPFWRASFRSRASFSLVLVYENLPCTWPFACQGNLAPCRSAFVPGFGEEHTLSWPDPLVYRSRLVSASFFSAFPQEPEISCFTVPQLPFPSGKPEACIGTALSTLFPPGVKDAFLSTKIVFSDLPSFSI